MTLTDELKKLTLDNVFVLCPHCQSKWKSSLSSEGFSCPNCKSIIEPKKHCVVSSEKEIN